MNNKLVIGIALIVLGAAILAFGHFSYQTRETVLEVGPIKATAEKTHNVPMPPVLGWVLISGGVCVLVFAGRTKA